MRAADDRRKPVPSPARHTSSKRKSNKGDPEEEPLTTADLTISTFHYFSERIEFKGIYRSELWPRHKIGHTFELSTEEFLPSVEVTGGLFAKLWNICTDPKETGPGVGTIRGSFAGTEGEDGHGLVRCEDCVFGRQHAKTRDLAGEPVQARFYVKTQKDPNSFQTASALQTSKAELQNMCDDLRGSITRYKRSKVGSHEEAEEIAKIVSGEDRKKHPAEEKVLEPSIADFIRLQYIVAADQLTHKLLCKVLALVPDLTISMYPIKGFAVVTTPMSIKLLQSESPTKSPGFQTGFLTLDQERRVVPLHPADPQAKVYTLVGIWVSGLPNVSPEDFSANNESLHKSKSAEPTNREQKLKKIAEREDKKARYLNSPLVLASILRFLFTDEIKSRMSPRPKSKENASPCYLLVHFAGAAALPQFLEFRLKTDREGSNSWILLESAHSVGKEGKGGFKPVNFRLTCNKEMAQGQQESYTVYKFSYILSLHQDTHPAKGKKAIASKSHEHDPDQENTEPNAKVVRSRNVSIKQAAETGVAKAHSAATHHHAKGGVVTKPTIMTVKMKNAEPGDNKPASSHRKRNDSVRSAADPPVRPTTTQATRVLRGSNAEGTKSGTLDYTRPVALTSTNATMDSCRTLPRSLKLRPESVKAAPVKIISGGLLRDKPDPSAPKEPITENSIIKLDEAEEGVAGYVTQNKGSDKKENTGPVLPGSENKHPTPSHNGSLNSSINSTCLHSSKLTGRVGQRMSGGCSGLDQSSVTDQFPSYSGNVSLVRTPEYSVLTSAGRTSPDVKRILIEQQRQIQMLHQQLVCVTEALRAMNPAGQKMSRSSYVTLAGTGTLNMSADLNNLRGRSHIGMYPTLNLSNNLSQSPTSFARGNQTVDANNVSSTNNSLCNINRLISGAGDVTNSDISGVESTTRPRPMPIPFILNPGSGVPSEAKASGNVLRPCPDPVEPKAAVGEDKIPAEETPSYSYYTCTTQHPSSQKPKPSPLKQPEPAKKPVLMPEPKKTISPAKKIVKRPKPEPPKTANLPSKQQTSSSNPTPNSHVAHSAHINNGSATSGRHPRVSVPVSDFTSRLPTGPSHREPKPGPKPVAKAVPKPEIAEKPEEVPRNMDPNFSLAGSGANQETAPIEPNLPAAASCEALSSIKETNESINSPEPEAARPKPVRKAQNTTQQTGKSDWTMDMPKIEYQNDSEGEADAQGKAKELTL